MAEQVGALGKRRLRDPLLCEWRLVRGQDADQVGRQRGDPPVRRIAERDGSDPAYAVDEQPRLGGTSTLGSEKTPMRAAQPSGRIAIGFGRVPAEGPAGRQAGKNSNIDNIGRVCDFAILAIRRIAAVGRRARQGPRYEGGDIRRLYEGAD